MIGIDVLSWKKREADGRQATQTETTTVSARTALADRGRPGQAPGCTLEVERPCSNAVLSEGQKRVHRMRADPAWQAARALPRTQKQERTSAFSALRERDGFSEYAFDEFARTLRVCFLADHLDAVLAQTLATRASQALNHMCLGKAKRVRFQSKGRGLESIEKKRNDIMWTSSECSEREFHITYAGLRFVLQQPEEGDTGDLLWHGDQLRARIDWNDPVVKYGLDHRITSARRIRRAPSSPRAQGADRRRYRSVVQQALEGVPSQKPTHPVGTDIIGLDLGSSTIANVPREGEARLEQYCEELVPDTQAIARVQRWMDRHRRAANPDNSDEHGRIKKQGKKKLHWKTSRTYEKTSCRKATKERTLAVHRKSVHGRLVHQIVRVGKTILTEKLSSKGWQKRDERSVGLRASGMFIEMLRRTVDVS